MTKLLSLGFMALLVAAITLSLRTCERRASQPEPMERVTPEAADEIIGLPDGGTLIAAKGTPGRRLIDWLDSRVAGSQSFEVGGREFEPGSAAPTREGAGRIPRLVMILRAYPDIQVVIVGHARASGDPKADLALSEARAKFVAEELRQSAVEQERLSIRAAGSSEPLPSDSPLRAGGASDDRVSLVLTRAAGD